jgi:hypothetical protein
MEDSNIQELRSKMEKHSHLCDSHNWKRLEQIEKSNNEDAAEIMLDSIEAALEDYEIEQGY